MFDDRIEDGSPIRCDPLRLDKNNKYAKKMLSGPLRELLAKGLFKP